MGLVKEFRDFAMKGNVVDLAVGVIIGAAFGKIVGSLVEDVIMPPIGKVVGGLDFNNLYVSLSDKIDAKNAALAKAVAATQPASDSSLAAVTDVFSSATRIPLAEAKALGPVIAYGSFLTTFINFLIIAFCIFLIIKVLNTAKKRFEKEEAAAPPPPTPEDTLLLREIRDSLNK